MTEVLPLQTQLQKQGSGPLQNLEGEDKGKELSFPFPLFQGKKGATRIINQMCSEECAAHEVVWSPGISKSDTCLKDVFHCSETNSPGTRPSAQTMGCRGGPHVGSSSSGFCLSFVIFCHYFWQLRALEDLDIERYFSTSVDTAQYCCLGTK